MEVLKEDLLPKLRGLTKTDFTKLELGKNSRGKKNQAMYEAFKDGERFVLTDKQLKLVPKKKK